PVIPSTIFSLMLSRVAEITCCLSKFLVSRFTIIESCVRAPSRSFFAIELMIFDACSSIPFIAMVVFSKIPTRIILAPMNRILYSSLKSKLSTYFKEDENEIIKKDTSDTAKTRRIIPLIFSVIGYVDFAYGTDLPINLPIQTVG